MRLRLRSLLVPVRRHAIPQLIIDAILVGVAYFIAYRLRFGFFTEPLPKHYHHLLDRTAAPVIALSLLSFVLFRVYLRSARFASVRDLVAIIEGSVVAVGASVAYVAIVRPVSYVPDFVLQSNLPQTPFNLARNARQASIPISVIAYFLLLLLVLIGGSRLVARLWHERGSLKGAHRRGARTVLIVGAGDGGRLVLREITRNPDLGLRPVGFVDDDPVKDGLRIDGVRVLGTTSELARILDDVEPDEVTIAIPSAPGTVRAQVVRDCRSRGIPVRTLPTVFELLQGGGRYVQQVREVKVEDILGRAPVKMELDRVGTYLRGQTVMVTGAGGSIGSELCRQIARVGPAKLILVDHAEDNLFEIHRELVGERHVGEDVATAVLADCREEDRMREVFGDHHPTAVFHAAAYKHVGLMEMNPVEAVRNNSLATRLVARLAGEWAVETFVLISTDKAVDPATVMGASKALAEWAVEAEQQRFPRTRYAAVRFGNVLGSSGSVVPIFRRQIAHGGPVTVTDPEMTRYFMTIPEAVQLVIRSGTLGTGGDLYVLEMGEPVKIMDLARTMIELSGLEPDKDVAIEVIGPRPGEKIHEELFGAHEKSTPTSAERIRRADRPQVAASVVDEAFDRINLLVLEGDAAGLAAEVSALITAARGDGDPDDPTTGDPAGGGAPAPGAPGAAVLQGSAPVRGPAES
ncbi:MAG: nucleoside-diphosphate sugar epimerase/dehydratase [Solirubrobacteraceae bacterium]|nr:nucleoside-diphosphate sugar epimerase/dehydratase [Patulibacter sp.]